MILKLALMIDTWSISDCDDTRLMISKEALMIHNWWSWSGKLNQLLDNWESCSNQDKWLWGHWGRAVKKLHEHFCLSSTAHSTSPYLLSVTVSFINKLAKPGQSYSQFLIFIEERKYETINFVSGTSVDLSWRAFVQVWILLTARSCLNTSDMSTSQVVVLSFLFFAFCWYSWWWSYS